MRLRVSQLSVVWRTCLVAWPIWVHPFKPLESTVRRPSMPGHVHRTTPQATTWTSWRANEANLILIKRQIWIFKCARVKTETKNFIYDAEKFSPSPAAPFYPIFPRFFIPYLKTNKKLYNEDNFHFFPLFFTSFEKWSWYFFIICFCKKKITATIIKN